MNEICKSKSCTDVIIEVVDDFKRYNKTAHYLIEKIATNIKEEKLTEWCYSNKNWKNIIIHFFFLILILNSL